MPWFNVDVVGIAHERYVVKAMDAEDAKARWYDGEIVKSEVDDCEVVEVTGAA